MSFLVDSISRNLKLDKDSIILEIGCAQGLSLCALKKLGYKNVSGIEPSDGALAKAAVLAGKLSIKLNVSKGVGEKIPREDHSVDLIFAQSVMEHVEDPIGVLGEAFRVLKKGGAFYFSTTSVACPAQSEIRFFPFFSWYPKFLKNKIMAWSLRCHPSLVGHADTPATHWYSAAGVRKMAAESGFRRIVGRWDLAAPGSGVSGAKKYIKGLICKSQVLRIFANLLLEGAEYLLIK